jgi:hypothetical protein
MVDEKSLLERGFNFSFFHPSSPFFDVIPGVTGQTENPKKISPQDLKHYSDLRHSTEWQMG